MANVFWAPAPWTQHYKTITGRHEDHEDEMNMRAQELTLDSRTVGQSYGSAAVVAAFGYQKHQLIANNQLFRNHSLTLRC